MDETITECKRCGLAFNLFCIRKKKFFSDPVHGAVVLYYYDCQNCDAKYIEDVETVGINEMHVRMQLYQYLLQQHEKKSLCAELLLDYKMTKKQIGIIKEELKNKYAHFERR